MIKGIDDEVWRLISCPLKQDFCANILDVKEVFCSPFLGVKQDFCSNILDVMGAFVQHLWVRIKTFVSSRFGCKDIVDAKQGFLFKHFGCEGRLLFKHFFKHFECEGRLVFTILGAKQDFCLWMWRRTFVHCFGCKARLLFKHFRCDGSFCLSFWVQARLLLNIMGVKLNFSCKYCGRETRLLFKHFGCEGRLLLNILGAKEDFCWPIWMQSKTLVQKSLDAKEDFC